MAGAWGWIPVFASLLAKLLLTVLAQHSQRREAAVPVLVGKVEVRIGVHEASAFKVDEKKLRVSEEIVAWGYPQWGTFCWN